MAIALHRGSGVSIEINITHSLTIIMTPLIRTILFSSILIGTFQQSSAVAEPPNASRVSPTIINNITKTLQDVIESRNYRILQKNASTEKPLFWDLCGYASDVEPGKLSSNDMVQMLLKSSGDYKIYFNPEPDILDFSENGYISIYTEGWSGEYPFLGFSFTVNKRTNKWSWSGVCYSAEPPSRIDKTTGKTTHVWPKKPSLPRPGPRIFKSDETLRARIMEIVKLQAFDALKPYAINQKLLISECNRKMIEEMDITGNYISIDQAIEVLKKNSQNSLKIRTIPGKYTYRETEGWSGDYPYFAFWISRGADGWEFSGLSYCKSPHFSLILEGDERTKYLKSVEKELNAQ